MKFTSKKSFEAIVVCAIAAIACYFLEKAGVSPLSVFSWVALEYLFLGMEIYGAYYYIRMMKEEKAEAKAKKLAEAENKAKAEAEARKLTEAHKAEAEAEARIEASRKEACEEATKVAFSKACKIITKARKEVELGSTELDKDFCELKRRFVTTKRAIATLNYLQSLEGKKLEYDQETGNFRIYAEDSNAKRALDITLTKSLDICMSGKATGLMKLPVDEKFIGEYINKAIKKLSRDAALAIMAIERKILPSTGSEPATDATDDSNCAEMADITVTILQTEKL